jgi:hypothetical protein
MNDAEDSPESFGDYLTRKIIGAVVFTAVTAVAGPVVGAVVAAAVSAGDGDVDVDIF